MLKITSMLMKMDGRSSAKNSHRKRKLKKRSNKKMILIIDINSGTKWKQATGMMETSTFSQKNVMDMEFGSVSMGSLFMKESLRMGRGMALGVLLWKMVITMKVSG